MENLSSTCIRTVQRFRRGSSWSYNFIFSVEFDTCFKVLRSNDISFEDKAFSFKEAPLYLLILGIFRQLDIQVNMVIILKAPYNVLMVFAEERSKLQSNSNGKQMEYLRFLVLMGQFSFQSVLFGY